MPGARCAVLGARGLYPAVPANSVCRCSVPGFPLDYSLDRGEGGDGPHPAGPHQPFIAARTPSLATQLFGEYSCKHPDVYIYICFYICVDADVDVYLYIHVYLSAIHM